MVQAISIDTLVSETTQDPITVQFDDAVFTDALQVIDAAFELNELRSQYETYDVAGKICKDVVTTEGVGGVVLGILGGAVLITGAIIASLIGYIIEVVSIIIRIIASPFVFIYKLIRTRSVKEAFESVKDLVFSGWTTLYFRQFKSTDNTETYADFDESSREYETNFHEYESEVDDALNNFRRDMSEAFSRKDGQPDDGGEPLFEGTISKIRSSKVFDKSNAEDADFQKLEHGNAPDGYVRTVENMSFQDAWSKEDTLKFVHVIDIDRASSEKNQKRVAEMHREFQKLEKQVNDKLLAKLNEQEKKNIYEIMNTLRLAIVDIAKKSSHHAQDVACIVSNTVQLLDACKYEFNQNVQNGFAFARDELSDLSATA